MMSRNTCLRSFYSLLLLALPLLLTSTVQAAPNGQPFQQLQNQVDQLYLNTTSDPIEVTVNCPGDSINDVLSEYGGIAAPLIITINGICNEVVLIQRDDVTLRGATSSDGITLTAPAFPGVGTSPGTNRTVIENMTLNFIAGFGILCNDSSITINNVTINHTGIGIAAVNNGRCLVTGSTIDGNGSGTGIMAGLLGSLQLGSSIVRNNYTGIYVHSNGDAFLGDFSGAMTTIENNTYGVRVYNGGNVNLVNTDVTNNGTGIELLPNTTLAINANLVPGSAGGFIHDNTGIGVIFHQNTSVINFNGAFNIQNNGGYGITCEPSVVFVGVSPTLSGNNSGGAQYLNCSFPP